MFVFICSEAFAQIGNDTQLIGGWGYPSDEFLTTGKINYTRVVVYPAKSSFHLLQEKKNYINIGISAIDSSQNYKSINEYIDDLKKWSDYINQPSNIIAFSQDDFVSWWTKATNRDPEALSQIKNAIKSIGSNFYYGATIYETDFDKLSKDQIKAIERNIDLICFYLHKRNNVNDYSRIWNNLRGLFPKSEILLGIYNYDRRGYEKRSASKDEELRLFKKQIDFCFSMLKNNEIKGIEFYPGSLGDNEMIVRKFNITGESMDILFQMTSFIKQKLQDIGD